jgi:hypothetical protein
MRIYNTITQFVKQKEEEEVYQCDLNESLSGS